MLAKQHQLAFFVFEHGKIIPFFLLGIQPRHVPQVHSFSCLSFRIHVDTVYEWSAFMVVFFITKFIAVIVVDIVSVHKNVGEFVWDVWREIKGFFTGEFILLDCGTVGWVGCEVVGTVPILWPLLGPKSKTGAEDAVYFSGEWGVDFDGATSFSQLVRLLHCRMIKSIVVFIL